MEAEYGGEIYFDTNGAARYMGVSRTTFGKRKQFIPASPLPGYGRDFYKKSDLDKYPVIKKIEPEK